MRHICSSCLRASLTAIEGGSNSLAIRILSRPFTTSPPRSAPDRSLHIRGLRPSEFGLRKEGDIRSSRSEPSSPRPPPPPPPPQRPSASIPSRAQSPESIPELPHLGAWTSLGVPSVIAQRLLLAYPHITLPTPAQRAFLLSVFKGLDVYLKDHMGRGKTLAIAAAAITIAYNQSLKPHSAASTIRTIVLAPTTHLLHQIERDMLLLDPSFSHPDHPDSPSNPSETSSRLFSVLDRDVNPDAPIPDSAPPVLLATPKDLHAQRQYLNLGDVKVVFIDEPDSMLPTLPPRRIGRKELLKHRVNIHPPALVHVMNDLLGINLETNNRGQVIEADFSGKRSVQTIWTSGTLDSDLRRFTKSRGWVRAKDKLADLDFTPTTSENRIRQRNEILGSDITDGRDVLTGSGPMTSIQGMEPDHYAVTVDVENGDLASLEQASGPTVLVEDSSTTRKGAVRPTILEALALLHTTSPPPIGSYALAVPPEGTSLDELSRELKMMGIPSLHLTPEILLDVSTLEGLEQEGPSPILLARRSVVPGIHLPKLHTIYLIGGLDVTNLGKRQMLRERVIFYDILVGRLGRLGTNLDLPQPVIPQRIISVVAKGGVEERGLGRLFFGSYSVHPGQEHVLKASEEDGADGDEVPKRWALQEWDMAEMEKLVTESIKE